MPSLYSEPSFALHRRGDLLGEKMGRFGCRLQRTQEGYRQLLVEQFGTALAKDTRTREHPRGTFDKRSPYRKLRRLEICPIGHSIT
jgi:hypothetical protein